MPLLKGIRDFGSFGLLQQLRANVVPSVATDFFMTICVDDLRAFANDIRNKVDHVLIERLALANQAILNREAREYRTRCGRRGLVADRVSIFVRDHFVPGHQSAVDRRFYHGYLATDTMHKTTKLIQELRDIGVEAPPRPVPPFNRLSSSPTPEEIEVDRVYQSLCVDWIETVARLHLAHFPKAS